MYKYLKKIDNTELISEWKPKGLSNEVIKPPSISNNSLSRTLKYTCKIMYVKFHGSCLRQDKITFDQGKIVNICIIYDLESNLNNLDPDLENCLFGAVKLIKNADIDKYKYSGYGIGFDSNWTFLFPDGSFAQNVTMSGADMSSSIHVDNKKKYSPIIGEGLTQGLDDTTLTAEKSTQLILLEVKRNFVSACILMEIIVICLSMIQRSLYSKNIANMKKID